MWIYILYIIIGIFAIGLTFLAYAVKKAPIGEEVEGKGFIEHTRNGVSNGSNRLHKHRDFLGNPTHSFRAGDKKETQKDSGEVK